MTVCVQFIVLIGHALINTLVVACFLWSLHAPSSHGVLALLVACLLQSLQAYSGRGVLTPVVTYSLYVRYSL